MGSVQKGEVIFGEMLTECGATARNLFRLRVKLFLALLTLVEQKKKPQTKDGRAAAPGCHVLWYTSHGRRLRSFPLKQRERGKTPQLMVGAVLEQDCLATDKGLQPVKRSL